jgi:hypothetical protein
MAYGADGCGLPLNIQNSADLATWTTVATNTSFQQHAAHYEFRAGNFSHTILARCLAAVSKNQFRLIRIRK